MYNNKMSTMMQRAACALVAMSALLLGGCATQGQMPAAAPDTSAVPLHDYLIGPGDNVNIIVWRNPEVSMSVPVRPDGKITTPLVEDLQASGKTTTELA